MRFFFIKGQGMKRTKYDDGSNMLGTGRLTTGELKIFDLLNSITRYRLVVRYFSIHRVIKLNELRFTNSVEVFNKKNDSKKF